MSNVYQINPKDAVYDQVCQWLACVDRGLSTDEEQQLRGWLAESHVNRELFIEVAEMWDAMDSLKRLSHLFPLQEESVATAAPSRRWMGAVAATVFLAFSGGLLVNSSVLMDGVNGVELAEQELRYQTEVGEQQSLTLEDGSVVHLNTDTILRVDYSDESRLFFLDKGEVHIDVAHDNARPLSVWVSGQLVQAVGTAFNVQLSGQDQVELTVTDGTVVVAPASVEVLYEKAATMAADGVPVTKGEQLTFNRDEIDATTVAAIPNDELEAQLAWQQGSVVFQGEPLEEVIQELSRYTNTRFTIVNPRLKSLRIAGLFKAGDVDALLAALEANFGIAHERESERSILLVAQSASVNE